MGAHVLEQIRFAADIESLARRVRVEPSGPLYHEFVTYAERAQEIAKPKAMYRVGYLGERGDDWVRIDGQRNLVGFNAAAAPEHGAFELDVLQKGLIAFLDQKHTNGLQSPAAVGDIQKNLPRLAHKGLRKIVSHLRHTTFQAGYEDHGQNNNR